MSLYEIQDESMAMFEMKMSIGMIGNVASSMKDALIVDRGIYNLYEFSGLSNHEIKLVRDKAETYVLNRQKFVSAKVIIKQLTKSNTNLHFLKSINGYFLLGLLQDDSRFECRRGLMIGLNHLSFNVKFLSLESEVIEYILRKNTPVTISEIINELSSTRELLVPSLSNMLSSNEKFIQMSPQRYTLTEGFETENHLDDSDINEAIFDDWEIE